jgi:hypothetical protein
VFMAINQRIEAKIAQMQAEKLAKLMSGETHLLLSDAKIQNAYSPVAWYRLCKSMHMLTLGMAIIRLHAAGKSQAEILKETGCTIGEYGAYKAWNTMYAKGLGIRLEKPKPNKQGVISKAKQAKYDADLAFLRECGISGEVSE